MNASVRPRRWSARNVTAVLGPTNTGKTHLAIERMLGHESGLIGLPLRLLAREVYQRVAGRVGEANVALVTGEEKILPANPRYWVSTVEAMPRETDAAFVAIDEVQLAADLERGHVFTDRMLSLRGTQETLLLGAATMRGIIEQLLPGVHVVTRPRMSVLAYAGQKKLTRLPERSAVVTFSADEVYAVGELIRRQRGGAAVVLGALSPRTRNKQVEIYQSGDVDFIVATDAIGMGLNLDLDHVAFAANRKYDGYQYRELSAAELGQIAGRAGRHMRDGTFGVTGRVDPFPDPLVEALETHRFEPVRTLQWRNDELDFASIAALKASLDEPPQVEGLTKAPPADDQVALETLARDEEITDRVRGPEQVRRLWEVCRLPDYRKIAPAQHAQLVTEIFGFLADGGTVPDDWIASQVRQAKNSEGDIDTLSSRIAHIRTWTFVANQPDWLADPATWREETKAVEDTLSDALHERLTKRFVDRRTSVLMRRLRENTMLEAEFTSAGDVLVEGHHVGVLQGFRFTPDPQAEGADAHALRNAAQKALASAIVDRADRFSRAGDREIVLALDGYLRWQGEPVARLVAGDDVLKPRLVILADEHLSGPPRDLVEARLTAWLSGHVATHLKPLIDLSQDESLAGMARGIAFRLVESLGILERRDVLEEVRGLDQDARGALRRHGVRFGAYHIYIPALLKPGPSTLLAQLWALKHRDFEVPGLAEMPAVSASGRTSVDVSPAFDPELYRRFGFRIHGSRAIRIDILERLADLIRPALAWNSSRPGERPPGAIPEGRAFTVIPAMTSLLGASGEAFAEILRSLGYRMEQRPKPAEEPAAAPAQAVQAQVAGPGADQSQSDSEPGDPPGTPPSEEPPVEEPTIEPPEREPPAETPPLEEPPPSDPPVAPPVPEEPPVEEPRAAEGATDETLSMPADAPAEPETVAAEPETIEVWLPAPLRTRREPRHRRPAGPRRAEAAGDGKEPRRVHTGGDGKEPRRRHGKPRSDEGKRKAGGPEHFGAPAPQQPQRRARERPVDPDSPFAALAALKQEMEKRGSE
jgi:ATP-dependent RNA helicase SUPV3L1/SUV3